MTEEEFAALQAEKEALLNKNRELLSELRTAKNKNKEIDPENYSKTLDENDTLKSELSKLKNDLGLKTKDFEKLNGQLLEKENYLNSLKLSNTIKEQITKNNIHPDDFEAVEAILEKSFKVVDGEVKAGDKDVDSFMAEYMQGKGQRYTLAKQNSGSGAAGSNGTATVKGNLSGSKSEQEAYIKAKFNL